MLLPFLLLVMKVIVHRTPAVLCVGLSFLLKKYNAYYAEDTKEKVLYLTFDCGFENGNTENILNALKKPRISPFVLEV